MWRFGKYFELLYSGALADLKPDKNGLYTLMLKDKNSRGDIVSISYQHKDDALRALQEAAEDGKLQVAPDCRRN